VSERNIEEGLKCSSAIVEEEMSETRNKLPDDN
jgi:hypothetical protein